MFGQGIAVFGIWMAVAVASYKNEPIVSIIMSFFAVIATIAVFQ